MAWTNDDIKKLKQLWQKGLSTVAIGQALGISKNAVIGKVHRLQLQARPSPIMATPKKSSVRGKKAVVKKAKIVKTAAKPAPKAKPGKVVPTKTRPVKKAVKPVAQKPISKVVKKSPVMKVAPKKIPPKKATPVARQAPAERPVAQVKKPTTLAKTAKKPVIIPQSRRELFTKKTSQIKQKGIALTELKANSCRWPLGDPNDPDFSFCGKEAVPGKPYCATHCLEAYTGVFKPR